MLREIGDWFAALFLSAAIAVTLLGVAEWAHGRTAVQAVTAENYTVAVDAGHGGFDGGAVGSESGVSEAGLNLVVAERLAAALEANGIRVVMTRRTDTALGDTKEEDIEKRKRMLGRADIDMIVSIHMNHFGDPAVAGAMSFYQMGSVEGQKLAQAVIDEVCAATGRAQRPANPGDYFVLRAGKGPAVLVECGFLSNAEEERKLLDESYLCAIAEAVARGVMTYLQS